MAEGKNAYGLACFWAGLTAGALVSAFCVSGSGAETRESLADRLREAFEPPRMRAKPAKAKSGSFESEIDEQVEDYIGGWRAQRSAPLEFSKSRAAEHRFQPSL